MKLIFYIKIYIETINNSIKSQSSYRLDFFLQLIIWFIYALIPFFGIYILFQRFGNINDWSLYHVGILYGVIGLSYDLARMIGRGFDNFHTYVVTGDLDIFYIRPLPIIFQVLGDKFFLRRLAGIFQSIIIMLYSLSKITLYNPLVIIILFIIITVISTFIIFLSLLIFYSSLCFYTIKKNIFSDVFIDSIARIAYYPLDTIMLPLKILLFGFVPVGFTAYLPIKNILFHDPNFIYLIISIMISFIFLIISIKVFNVSSKKYMSINN